jgi:hypothetical protein
MGTIQAQLKDDAKAALKMCADGLASIRSQESDGTAGKAQLTARRLVLHSVQAFENYLGETPPLNYGELLKYGKRDALPVASLPSTEEIARYTDEILGQVLDCLGRHGDEQLLDERNKWGKSLFWRTYYCIRHAHQHLGHVDQLLYAKSDPRKWRCFSYRYDD